MLCGVISESIRVWWTITEWNVEKVRRWKLQYKGWADWNTGRSLLKTTKVLHAAFNHRNDSH